MAQRPPSRRAKEPANAADRRDRDADHKSNPPQRAPDDPVNRQALRHQRIRRDHSSEIAEDYVEIVAQLVRAHGEARTVDIARRLGVSHVTVTKTIARLQKEGLVRTEPYRSIHLTDQGRGLAERIEQRHELVVRFLRKIGVDEHAAEIDAEGIEHHVSDATLAAMKRWLGEK